MATISLKIANRAEEDLVKKQKCEKRNFKASPVLFNELTIQYDFEYTSNKVQIQIYDLNGRLLITYSAKKVTRGDVKEPM